MEQQRPPIQLREGEPGPRMGTTWARQQPYQLGAGPQLGKQSKVVAAMVPVNNPGVTRQNQGTKFSPRSIWETLGAHAPTEQLRKKGAAQTSA